MAKPILTVIAHDPLPTLRAKLKDIRDIAHKTRLKAIIKAREGKKRAEIAQELIVSERSISTWIGAYNTGGMAALETKPSGRKSGPQRWKTAIFDNLAKEIDKGGYWSIPRMQEWLSKHCSVNIPEQTVWYRMDQLNYSYKPARPHPIKGNKERQEVFKKGGSFHSWSR